MITKMPAVCTPILGTRLVETLLRVEAGGESVRVRSAQPHRTQGGVDFYNSTGMSAGAERLHR